MGDDTGRSPATPFKRIRTLRSAVGFLREEGYLEAATKLEAMLAPGVNEKRAASWSAEACDDWIARFGGSAPGGRIARGLRPLVRKYGWLRVRPVWQRYLRQTDSRFVNPQTFADKFIDHVRDAGRGHDVVHTTRLEHAAAAFNAVLRSAERGIVNNAAWWTKERVQELCGERSARAFMAAGGPSAFSSMTERSEAFVRRDFVKAFLALE